MSEQQVETRSSSTPATAGKGRGAEAYFSARDLHAYYGESYIVQGVGFNVREGEILALLGRKRGLQDVDAEGDRSAR